MVIGEQLSLFQPRAAALALRDTPYNSTAHALAELVDNSVDARARQIDVLMLNRRQESASGQFVNRLDRLAVIDNGHGMSPDVLVQALVVGGRPAEGGIINRRIGKYGVGLPTSSLSQCRRVDVWSWQDGSDSVWHSYLDVDEIIDGRIYVPAADQEPIPALWLDQSRDEIRISPTGTLVVWSKLDRVDWRRSVTTMERVEEEVGRIYRHFIIKGEIDMGMRSFGEDGSEDSFRLIRHNDPLYLTTGTVFPHRHDDDPMFQLWGEQSWPVTVNGVEHIVRAVYSLVKESVLLDLDIGVAGATEYGRKARRNVGISVVREGRELMVLPPLSNLGDTRNRWWGCELHFNRGCDDLFGVDHSKQLAARLQAVHRSVQRGRADGHPDFEEELALEDGDQDRIDLYNIVSKIRADTGAMFRQIRGMRATPPKTPPVGPDDVIPMPDITGGLGKAITENVDDAIARGDSDPTDTDVNRETLSEDEVLRGVASVLESDGMEPGASRRIAAWVAAEGIRYTINPGLVPGSSLFYVRNDHGTLRIVLNQEHRLCRLLRELMEADEEDSGGSDGIDRAKAYSEMIFALLFAWARMFDRTPGMQDRQRFEDVVNRWGFEASLMLTTLTQQLIGNEE